METLLAEIKIKTGQVEKCSNYNLLSYEIGGDNAEASTLVSLEIDLQNRSRLIFVGS